MRTITAGAVKPGMTIKTFPGQAGSSEPITLTVADGGWCGPDYTEPADPANPTHVYLAEAFPSDAEVLLPVTAPVLVVSE